MPTRQALPGLTQNIVSFSRSVEDEDCPRYDVTILCDCEVEREGSQFYRHYFGSA